MCIRDRTTICRVNLLRQIYITEGRQIEDHRVFTWYRTRSFLWLCVRLHDITRKFSTRTNHTGGEFTPVSPPKWEFQNDGKPLVLDNIGWSRTERKCFPMSLPSLSYSRYGKKHGGMWRWWINCSSRNALFYYNAIYRRICSFFAGRTIFHHFYFGYGRTTMTSETSENTIFAGTSPCYLMLPGTSCACVYYQICFSKVPRTFRARKASCQTVIIHTYIFINPLSE